MSIRSIWLTLSVALLFHSLPAQQNNLKALVGGTLIDGFSSTPIRNSVIIIEGEKIKAVGEMGKLAIYH